MLDARMPPTPTGIGSIPYFKLHGMPYGKLGKLLRLPFFFASSTKQHPLALGIPGREKKAEETYLDGANNSNQLEL